MIVSQIPNVTPMNLGGFTTAAIPNILVPQEFPEEEDRLFISKCCYDNVVLAGGDKIYQNDRTSFLFKVFSQSDTVEFFLEEDVLGVVASLNDNTLGELFPIGGFANQPLLVGFRVDWEKVLLAHGEGNYKIRIERSLLTGTDTILSVNYHLKTFSIDLADNTIYIEWTHNGEIIDGLDYTGINWFQGIRVPGFFGNKQPEFEETVYKKSNYEVFQIKNEMKFPRIVEIGPIPSCIGNFLPNLAQANIIQITDYNISNFDYLLQQKVVRLSEISDTDYGRRTRNAVYNLTFTDRIEDHIKINC